MSRQSSAKRPWLAAGLTVFVPGLGQLYLRRWLRALGWIGLLLLTGFLFVPESALTDPRSATFWESAPLFIVGLLSVVDAYVLAKQHNLRLEAETVARCSSCYRELDSELSFCPWCATDVSETPEDADVDGDPVHSDGDDNQNDDRR